MAASSKLNNNLQQSGAMSAALKLFLVAEEAIYDWMPFLTSTSIGTYREKFRENPNLNKFEISGFKLENVNKIFDFFYSDTIIINKNDLNEIVRLAKIFQLNRVLDKVFNYVKDDLNVENVLSIRDLWMSCDKMEEVKICDQFIEKNLNDISKLQIFKVIEFNYLKLLMKSNNLVVPDEKRIFEIAIDWLNVDIQTRQQFGQQLMENVRFPLMPYEFLLQTSDHEIIQNAKSMKRIMESVQYSNKKEFRIGQNILTSVDITPRKYQNVFVNECTFTSFKVEGVIKLVARTKEMGGDPVGKRFESQHNQKHKVKNEKMKLKLEDARFKQGQSSYKHIEMVEWSGVEVVVSH
ncbi:Ring canal kelch protein [Nymphon striatum]|nr:Ring canal kelch protein [Nymphon striatum]